MRAINQKLLLASLLEYKLVSEVVSMIRNLLFLSQVEICQGRQLVEIKFQKTQFHNLYKKKRKKCWIGLTGYLFLLQPGTDHSYQNTEI